MAINRQQSLIGEIGGFLGRSFAGIGVGVMAAMGLYLIGSGKSFIPRLVG